jgi:hypothetical protein
MTIDALKFFQAYITEMINIGGENLPKTISAGLGGNLAKLYKSRGITTIEAALKETYTVLGAKVQINRVNQNELEITSRYSSNFCPIGGKYNPDKAELIQKSICIPYTSGFLNEMDPKFKYSWKLHECILNKDCDCCRYTLYMEKKE